MIEVREITTKKDFEEFKSASGLNIVKVGAPWCGPCRVLAGTLRNLDPEKINGANFAEIDMESSDEMDELASELAIRSIPVMLFFKDGELVTKTTGNVSSADIYKAITDFS